MVLALTGVAHYLNTALATVVPQHTAAQLRDRPDIEQVLPGYMDALAAARDALSPHLDASGAWARPEADGFGGPDDVVHDERFSTDSTMDGPQVVDGHEVLIWRPSVWLHPGVLHTDPADAARAQADLIQALRPYGLVLQQGSPLKEGPAGPYFSVTATDRHGARLEVYSRADVTELSFTSGAHLYAAGTPGCDVSECHPFVGFS